jgi:hypothetical protein
VRTLDSVVNHAPRYLVQWLDVDGFLLLAVLWDDPPSPFDLPLGGGAAVVLRWDVV